MAGTGATPTALDGITKDVYEPGVSEGVNNSFPLKDVFKPEKVDYQGGYGHVWNHHNGRNTSPMFVGPDSAFAEAGYQASVRGQIDIRKMMARLRLPVETMEDLTGNQSSFVNAMTDEKTRLVDDISKREEFALSSDGRGVFCLLNGDPGTGVTPAELDAPGNISGADFGNRFIQKGMYLAAINPATGAIRAGIIKVVDVNSDGTDITPDAAYNTAWADNDYLVQAANASVTDVLDTSYEKAFWGLPALVDDGTNRDNYYGALRTSVPSLKSYVVSSAGAFSLDLAQRTSDVVNEKLGGEVDLLLMHHSVRREYIKLLQQDVRYIGSATMRPDGGTVAMKGGDLALGEIPVKAIRSLGLAQVYFLDTKKSGFKQYVAEAGKFEDRDGSIWVREGTGTTARHAFEAWWYSRKQNFCKNPGFNARWDGVTGQTLVVVRDE